MRTAHLFVLLPPLLTACADLQVDSAQLTTEQRRIVIERARENVVKSDLALRPEEFKVVMKEVPSLSFYFLARPYADYILRWPVAHGEAILVHGCGNLFELEGAVVERTGSAP
jgi:hypothetical protein